MTTVSLMDFLADKLISLSSKIGDSSKLNGSSYLMNDSSKVSVDMLNGLMGDSMFSSETINPVMPLKQSLGYNYFSSRNSEKFFSRHLSDLIPNVYRHTHCLSESLIMANNMMVSHFIDSVLLPGLSNMNSSVKLDSDLIRPTSTIISKNNMSENSSRSKKTSEATMKCKSPNVSTLNKELISRKTKEMNKKSKKRRRRQKKNQQIDFSSSASVSDEEVDKSNQSSVTNCMYLVSKSPQGCTVAVSHSLHMRPNVISSFLVPVDSASDDDSEWESYDYEQCIENSQNKKSSDENIQSSCISSQTKPENADLKCVQPINCDFVKATTFISSFIIPLGSSSDDDDDSDWDSCKADNFEEAPEIKFTGLLLSNLCTPQTLPSEINAVNEDEETIKLKAHLEEVNKNWNKSNEGVVIVEPKTIKVSFAPDEVLVEVFPADIYERKGEWEMYATERLRFKRKIDELEKVLSPCLSPEHRLKIYNKLNNSACINAAL